MIGRNDPCSCGSGKKYKKCCLGKNEIPIEKLIDEELERILLGVYEHRPEQSAMAEFEGYERQWTDKLGKQWDKNSIEGSVTEYFMFIARRDLWKRYLLKVLNGPIRSAVRSVVEMWREPFVLFGKVKEEKNGFVEVEEVLGNETYFLEKKQDMPADKDSIVFGVVFRDNRIHENGVYVVTALMFIKDGNGVFQKEIETLAESSGFGTSNEFYKEHMVDVYYSMLNRETSTVEELIESDLTRNSARGA